MTRIKFFRLSVIAVISIILTGCSSGVNNPVAAEVGNSDGLGDIITHRDQSGTFMLGLWYCSMEPGETQIDITPLRTAEITLNINNLLSNSPGTFTIGDLDLSNFDTGRLGCTITIKHPLDDMDQFHIFDVLGVFLHNGASILEFDPSAPTYSGGPDAGENEALLLNPDGYTRWFNQPEFDGDGPPILEYTPMGFSNLPLPTAVLNPYKIFADSLGEETDYYTWITTPGYSNFRNIFRAGMSNSRRYDFQFPMIDSVPVLNFQFAVIANWEPGDPTLTGNPNVYEPGDFPSSANREEPFFVNVSTVASSLYFDSTGPVPEFGGNFIIDIEIFDWQGGQVEGNGVLNEIERVVIETDFIHFSGIVQITHPDLKFMSMPGTENSSVVHVEFYDCTPQEAGEIEYWVIVESSGLRGDSYYQGLPSLYPENVRRSTYKRESIWISPEAPWVNTPPDITGIEDDIIGPGAYQNPITDDDKSVTYSPIFTDPDIDQTWEITWWIVNKLAWPLPSGIVEMPVDWSNYELKDYDIYVMVDDGYDAVQSGPYDITVIKGSVPEWTEPLLIDYSSCMPRAVENWDNDLVLIYHKQHTGIMYAVNTGEWSVPETAYYWTDGGDKETAPTCLSITRGESGKTVYGSFSGWGEDEMSTMEIDRHAIRWNGDTGAWDYTYLWGMAEQATLMLPDDDGSYLNVYNFTFMGDPGPELRGSDRAFWGQTVHDPFLLPTYDSWSCTISNCKAAERDEYFHYIAYRRVLGGQSARIARISKSSVTVHGEFSIYDGVNNEEIDSVALDMDSSGNLHAAWRVYDDDLYRIDYANSSDGGTTWSEAMTVFKVPESYYGIQGNQVGIVTNSSDNIYIIFAWDLYLYMVTSEDGVLWSEPDSPYTGPLPLGWHHTQPYPVMTSDDILHVFYLAKNEQWQFGNLLEITFGL